jgi:hypothetical protein
MESKPVVSNSGPYHRENTTSEDFVLCMSLKRTLNPLPLLRVSLETNAFEHSSEEGVTWRKCNGDCYLGSIEIEC